jgi:Leucine-rich repeat (LRR) protein
MADSKEALQYLQKVDVSQNKITTLPAIQCTSLKKLVLDENQIHDNNLAGHPSLNTLSVNKNWLENCTNFSDMPALESLSLEE